MRRLSLAALAGVACFACADEARDPQAGQEAQATEEAAAALAPVPALLPGEGLVFVRSTASGGTDLWLGSLSKGLVAPLLETANAVEAAPHWLPSALRIVYLSRPTSDPAQARLKLIDPESGEVLMATDLSGWVEGAAVVSPEGTRVAYPFVAPPGQRPERGIRVLDPLTSRTETLPVVPGAIGYPTVQFSADGRSAAVQVYRENRGDDIYLLSRSGEGRSIVENPRWRDASPRFTYQGDSVVFSRSPYPPPKPGRPDVGGGGVCIVHLEFRQVRCPRKSADAREYGAVPSPTAAEMVFVVLKNGETDLFLSDLDGRNERRLTETPEAEWAAVWSPDGQRIAFEVGPPDARRVRVIDREGKLLFDEPGFAPDWTPPFL